MKIPTLNTITFDGKPNQMIIFKRALKALIDHSQQLIAFDKLLVDQKQLSPFRSSFEQGSLIIEPTNEQDLATAAPIFIKTINPQSVQINLWTDHYPIDQDFLQQLAKTYQLDLINLKYYQPENNFYYGIALINQKQIKTINQQLKTKLKPAATDFAKALEILEHQLAHPVKQSTIKI